MNIFILSTGRCGSMSFAKACAHISNYTSGHETRSHICGEERLAYPKDHIESDNRLSWFLGRLDKQYGEQSFYVHLKRSEEKVAMSYASRAGIKGLIMEAYKNGIYLHAKEKEYLPFALDYVETVNSNIQLFLKDKPNKMVFDLDGDSKKQFEQFWTSIGAKGDLCSAMLEFEVTHNASRKRSVLGKIKGRLLG